MRPYEGALGGRAGEVFQRMLAEAAESRVSLCRCLLVMYLFSFNTET